MAVHYSKAIHYIWDKGIHKLHKKTHPSIPKEEEPYILIQLLNDGILADVDESELQLYWETKEGEDAGSERGELIDRKYSIFKITLSSERFQQEEELEGRLYFLDKKERKSNLKVKIHLNHQIRMESVIGSNDVSTRTKPISNKTYPLFEAPVVQGRVAYQNYRTIKKRIKKFSNHEIIGQDASGEYNIYQIKMGNPAKPTILVTAAIHGVEWQTVQYSLAFFEKLRDKSYPNQEFRKDILENYQIVYLPVLNPHGLDKNDDREAPTDLSYYRNSNNVDLNRDFEVQSQAETKSVVEVMEQYQPFAHMDLHMFQPTYDLNNNFIVGNELAATKKYQEIIAFNLDQFTDQGVTIWEPRPYYKKRARGYTAKLGNEHTPVTLSILSEQVRPIIADGEEIRRLSNAEIYTNGHAFLHIFLKTADYYFKKEAKKD